MRSILVLSFIFFVSACSDKGSPKLNSDFSQKVIYGEDDRLDLYEVSDEALLNLADSTVGLINTSNLASVDEDTFSITERSPRLCETEPYSDQMSGPSCSGFLVTPDLVVTAGHCITQSRCSSVSFIFGYAKQSEDHDTSSISKSEVYNCAEVIGREEVGTGADWAVVRLDREVTNHSPLRIRREGIPELETNLTVIGHPMGLPTKIVGNAKIREMREAFFVANLDTYGGNSGSAVFNTITGEVEGILVRGERDFVFNPSGCRESNVCEDDSCRGEDVTLISEVLDLVPDLGDAPVDPVPPPTDPEPDDEEQEEQNEFASNVSLVIPDSSLSKVESVIKDVPAIADTSRIKVGLSITHTYIGDLRVSLIAPNGQKILLHNRTGWSSDDIVGIYGEDLNPFEDFSLLGAQPAGDWILEVKDLAPFDTGTIDSWLLSINAKD